jgi:hypothetical protein
MEKDPLENDDICSCGRSHIKAHCPHCGSYTVTAYAKRDRVNTGDGQVELVRSYRCRRCSEVFNEIQWKTKCLAPSPQVGRPSKKPKDVVFKNMKDVDDFNPALAREANAAIERFLKRTKAEAEEQKPKPKQDNTEALKKWGLIENDD